MKLISKEKLATMSKEDKIAFIEAIREKKRRLKKTRPAYKPHSGQEEIHKSPARNRFVFAANGCWAPGTLIRMFDGSTKPVEKVKYGDLLMGPDSTPRKVIKTYKGAEPMYLITPSASDPYVVNQDHMMSLYYWSKSRRKSVLKYEEISVKDFVAQSPGKQRRSYQHRPKNGVSYPEAELPIDPYVFGAWLGDGTSSATAVTTMDACVIDAFKQEFKDYAVREVEAGLASTYFFSNNGRNDFRKTLRQLNVLNNKHIPNIYLINSEKNRLELLAGLMDTDGYLDNGMYYEVAQKNYNVGYGIKELAQSLGFRVSTSTKMIEGKPYMRLLIAGDIHRIPVRIPYKKADPKRHKQREYWREPFKVQPLGEGKFYGFQVNGDNKVLLADYTVQCNSGKTCLEVHEAVAAAKGFNPWLDKYTHVPAKIIVVLDRPDKVSDVWIQEATKWYDTSDWTFDKQGKPYITKITLPNGSTINFMFALMEPLAFESIEVDFCVIDEPIPRKIWVALQRGGRTKGREARYLFIGTPISAAWLRTDIYEPWTRGELPDVECFRFGTKLNEHNLQDGFIGTFSKHLTEKEKRVRLEGEFFDTDGLALASMFKRDRHVISRENFENVFDMKGNPCVLAIDPHSSKPHHACLLGVDKDGFFYYIKEIKEKVVPKDFAKVLKKFIEGFRVVDIVWDSSGEAESTGGDGYKSFSTVMKENGIYGRATTFNDKSDEDFIDRIKTVLAVPTEPDNFGRYLPKLRIVEGNLGIISDIENVGWQKYRDIDAVKPKLEIRERDFLAALKYALASGIGPKSGNTKPYKPPQAQGAYGMNKKKGSISMRYNRNRRFQTDEDEDF